MASRRWRLYCTVLYCTVLYCTVLQVAAGALLDMFPQDLLEHSNKVRPVNVKIIEHDGYIDYEIEFVELEDYYDYLDEADL